MEDLKELRRLAEIVASHEPDFKDIHEYLEALRNMQGELSGTTVLALLSRLEQAEKNADTYQTLYEQRAESLEQAEQAVARVREALSEVQTRGEQIRAKGNNGSIYQQERAARGEGYLEATRLAFRALDGDTRRLADDALTARTTKNGDNK